MQEKYKYSNPNAVTSDVMDTSSLVEVTNNIARSN